MHLSSRATAPPSPNCTQASKDRIGCPSNKTTAVTVAVSMLVLLVAFVVLMCIKRKSLERAASAAAGDRSYFRLSELLPYSRYRAKKPSSKAEGGHQQLDDSLPICVICLEPFSESQTIYSLACDHVYHRRCLEGWYGNRHQTCPLCNKPFISKSKHEGTTSVH